MAVHRNLDITVKVKTKDLIDALKRNKKKHQEEYGEVVILYFKDLKKLLQQRLNRVDHSDLEFNYNINLAKPIDNTKLYEKYIGMFSLATDETIEISSEEYGCIVDDNWDWAMTAKTINSTYFQSK